jgi:hypothetical protein
MAGLRDFSRFMVADTRISESLPVPSNRVACFVLGAVVIRRESSSNAGPGPCGNGQGS